MTEPSPLPGYRLEDRSVPLPDLSGALLPLALLLFAAPLLLHALLHGLDLGAALQIGLLPAFLLFIVAHEVTHAVGWKFASGLPWSRFSFGIDWKTLSPYCHAKDAMGMTPYRFGALLPLVITGVLPALYGLLAADGTWTLLGAVMISGAIGDLYVVWLLRAAPAAALARDHSSHAGCWLYIPEND